MNCSARLWSGLDVGRVITPVLTEPTLERQVDRLLDELPDHVALAGLSLGAVVAMALTRRAPERVDRLALLSTNPHAPTPKQCAGWQAQRHRVAAGASAREVQTDLLPVLLSDEAPAALIEQTLVMADEVGAELLDAQLRLQASRIDERPGLTAVRCPTLVIAAHDDRLCPVSRHTELAALIPGAELVVLSRTAHLSPLERPAEITRLLHSWLP